MTIEGFIFLFVLISFPLLYTIALSICAWRNETCSNTHHIGVLGLIVIWLFPPIYWYRYTRTVLVHENRLRNCIDVLMSVLLCYCGMMGISGLAGIGVDLAFARVIVHLLWFTVPVVTTVASLLYRIRNRGKTGGRKD